MTKKFNQYIGKAGQLAIMSEFLMRGWNVAIPEVDIGDDIFVVQDENGTLRRVQVKTSKATIRKEGFTAQFNIPLNQLKDIRDILVHYVFIVRNNDSWTKPIIFSQDILLELFEKNKIGSEHNGNIVLYFSYTNKKVSCSGIDLTVYLCDYKDFPMVTH